MKNRWLTLTATIAILALGALMTGAVFAQEADAGGDGLAGGGAALDSDGFGAVGRLVVVDGNAATGLCELQSGGRANATGGAARTLLRQTF